MARHGISFLNSDIDASVIETVGSLVSVDTLNGRYRVSLPIMMPSGGLIDVSVYREPGETYLVSDDGAAFFEVSGFDIHKRSFSAVANDMSGRVGATYDGESFLFMRVTAAQLRTAIIAIANLSAAVATEVVERSIRSKHDTIRDRVFENIDRAFAGKHIEHDVELYGYSTASYKFDAMVDTDHGKVAFDIFTKDPISIAATYTKLSDVNRSEDGPKLVGVTRNPESIGPKLTLISSVARIISANAAEDTYRKLAA